jgi:antitoxin ParD1/3/4
MTITVDLGMQQTSLQRHLKTGRYDDAGDVLKDALRALDREEEELEEMLRQDVQAAMADKRPSVPEELVFERLEARHAFLII